MSTQTLTTTGIIGGTSLPKGLFARVVAWLDEQRRYRRTAEELAQLSDRELSDIGLSRAEIDSVARRCAHCA